MIFRNFLFLFFLTILFSCSRESSVIGLSSHEGLPIELELNSENLEEFISNGYNKRTDHLYYSDRYLVPKYYNELDAVLEIPEKKNLSVSFINSESQNLGPVFNGRCEKLILSISSLLNDDNQIIGLIFYYMDYDESLKVAIYSKAKASSKSYELIDFPAKDVHYINFDQLLFLNRSVFGSSVTKIETIGLDRIQILSTKNQIDELGVLVLAMNYNLKESCKAYFDFMEKNGPQEGQYKSTLVMAPEPGNGQEGCGLVHQCRDNSLGPACMPFNGGCREQPCAKKDVEAEYGTYGLTSDLVIYLQNLNDIALYDFRDSLVSTKRGMFYIKAYYNLSGSFLSTVDIPMLIEIAKVSPALKKLTDAIRHRNKTYILSSADYQSFIKILQLSSINSTNNTYQSLINDLIDDLKKYEGQSVSGIYKLLNN